MVSRVYTSEDMACRRLIRETLTTHPNLSHDPDLINQAVETLCQYDQLDLDKLATFIVLSNRGTGIGRLALIHHYWLNYYLTNSDWEGLWSYYQNDLDTIVEVENNPYLSQDDIDLIYDSIEVDRQTVISMIRNYRDVKSRDQPLIACPTSYQEIELTLNQEKLGFSSYYHKCRYTVCLSNGKYPGSASSSREVYFKDRNPNQVMPTIYCFDLERLLELLVETPTGPVINPQSGEYFTSGAVDFIREKYHIEIAIYRYSLQVLGNEI